MSICVPAKGGSMSENYLCADDIGKENSCMSGIVFLGIWNGNSLSFDCSLKQDGLPNHVVCEESNYLVKESEFPIQKEPVTQVAADAHYKDTIFRKLFSEKQEALSLYNALNNTQYTDYNELEVVTLENAIYMNIKNDLAFIMDSSLNMYEHQSTYGPNMPLRNLIYVASEYQKLINNRSLFSQRPIKIPTPRFVVFFNGMYPEEEQKILKLSDMFESPTLEPELELKVLVLNINRGYNEELKKNCKTLRDYMTYVDKVRSYHHLKRFSLEVAVENAIKECLEEGVLVDFLKENRSQLVGASIFEYDEELFKKDEYEYGMELGIERGIEQGIEQGREEALFEIVQTCLNNGKTCEEIAMFNGIPIAKVQEIQRNLQNVGEE